MQIDKNKHICESFEKGVYVDNALNRKLGRVGLTYGNDRKKENEKYIPTNGFITRDLFFKEGKWDEKRVKGVHEGIVREYADKLVDYLDSIGGEDKNPTVYLMLGGSGSGKGFVLRNLQEKDKSLKKIPVLNSDDIKQKIPEYSKVHPVEAANFVHKESSYLNKVITEMYIDSKSSFVIDGTFSDTEEAEDLVNRLNKLGYDIKLYGVATDLTIAKKRSHNRYMNKKRYVPNQVIERTHRGASKTFDTFINSDDIKDKVSTIQLWDGNNDSGMIYDYQKSDKDSNPIKKSKLLRRFINKQYK